MRLEDLKFEDVKQISCFPVRKHGEETFVCKVDTKKGEVFQVEPEGLIISKETATLIFR